MSSPPPFVGAVLCGGASRRMGRDKALLEVDGTPMAVRVADELAAAGAAPVIAVGGDPGRLGVLGLTVVPDDRPGEGPLAAVATALRHAPPEVGIVLVAACDLVNPSAAAMAAVVHALGRAPEADLAVPLAGGRPQWGHAAWRTRAAAHVEARLAAGERSIHRAVDAGLQAMLLAGFGDAALADADTPADLPAAPDRGGEGHAH